MKKNKFKLIKVQLVLVVDAEELEEAKDDIDHSFESILGGGAFGKPRNKLVHGVVGAEILKERNISDCLDEYPTYDDGKLYHSI